MRRSIPRIWLPGAGSDLREWLKARENKKENEKKGYSIGQSPWEKQLTCSWTEEKTKKDARFALFETYFERFYLWRFYESTTFEEVKSLKGKIMVFSLLSDLGTKDFGFRR